MSNAKERRRAARQAAQALTWPDGWLVFCKSCGWLPAQGHIGPCSKCGFRTFAIVPPVGDDDDEREIDGSRVLAAQFGLLPSDEAVAVLARYAEWQRLTDGAADMGLKRVDVRWVPDAGRGDKMSD